MLFFIFGLIPSFSPGHEELCLYISNFIQLAFLPVIMFGQNVLGKTSRQQAYQDHLSIKKMLENNAEEMKELKRIIQELNDSQ